MILEIYRVFNKKGIFCLIFVQESFMKQFFFIKYEFEFYIIEKVEGLIEKIFFKIKYLEILKEKIKSKIGELVDRIFIILVLEK